MTTSLASNWTLWYHSPIFKQHTHNHHQQQQDSIETKKTEGEEKKIETKKSSSDEDWISECKTANPQIETLEYFNEFMDVLSGKTKPEGAEETNYEKMIQNCMFFMMRDDIEPSWKHPANENGGYWSFLVHKPYVVNIWCKLSKYLVTEKILNENNEIQVNGIATSPKKNYCIVKIWVRSELSDFNVINKEVLNFMGTEPQFIPCSGKK
jgi:hypothetical protein